MINYKIKKGDTLRSIAKLFGVSIFDLINANKGKEIKVGEILRIPKEYSGDIKEINSEILEQFQPIHSKLKTISEKDTFKIFGINDLIKDIKSFFSDLSNKIFKVDVKNKKFDVDVKNDITISNPTDLSNLENISSNSLDKLSDIEKKEQYSTKETKPMSVRLSDGKKFYKAVFNNAIKLTKLEKLTTSVVDYLTSINSKLLLTTQKFLKIDVQNPLPTDGDSVYIKDIWVSESDTTNWTDLDGAGGDVINIPFNNLHTAIENSTTDNPKVIRIHFNRTVSLDQVGLGCADHAGKNFSNVLIKVLGSGGVEREVLDDSNDNTKRTSKDYKFTAELCNAIEIEFHTADTVTITNITIHKVIRTNANIRLKKPDGSFTFMQGTSGGNAKISLEEYDDSFLSNPLPVADFNLNVAKGLIPGHSILSKFGQNTDIGTGAYEDIWDNGGVYTYPTNGTAPITHLIGHDVADTEPIEAQGLDINGTLTLQTITLTGLTAVALTTPLWRVFRLKNVGTSDLVADVCAIDTGDTIDYACIDNGNNQTLMALYTIPLGHTGYLLQGSNSIIGTNRGYSIDGKLLMRPYGSVFQLKKTFGLNSEGTGFILMPQPLPGKIPSLTDIRISAISSASGGGLNSTFEILLVEDGF